jgi:hypothetical protein
MKPYECSDPMCEASKQVDALQTERDVLKKICSEMAENNKKLRESFQYEVVALDAQLQRIRSLAARSL